MDCEMAPSGNEVGVWRYRLSGYVWPLAGICLTRTATKVLPCQRRCLLRGPPVVQAVICRVCACALRRAPFAPACAARAAGSKVRHDGGADPVVVLDHRHPAPWVESAAGLGDAPAHAAADRRRERPTGPVPAPAAADRRRERLIGGVPAQAGVLVVQRGRGVGRGTERRTWPLRAPQCAPCCQVSAPLTITASMPTAAPAAASKITRSARWPGCSVPRSCRPKVRAVSPVIFHTAVSSGNKPMSRL